MQPEFQSQTWWWLSGRTQQVPDHPCSQKHVQVSLKPLPCQCLTSVPLLWIHQIPKWTFCPGLQTLQFLYGQKGSSEGQTVSACVHQHRCHPGQGHCHLLCEEWFCWAPSNKMESALAWLCHPPKVSEWGVQPALSWPWTQELPGSPFSSNKVFPFSGLCSTCQIFLNTFCAVPLWCFPGAPKEAIFHQYLVGMESSTPPLINSLQMLQSHVCFTLPSVPLPCHTMALAALTVAAFE